MKITKRQLRRIIKEEKQKLLEIGAPAEKSAFLATQQAIWEDHLGMGYGADEADDAQVIKDFLSNAYDGIQNRLERW